MYNKLFTKILDSSIWLEPTPTRIVWLTMLAVMDQDGMVQFASVANLAHRARVSLEEATEAVRCLETPDPNSSDPSHEGRRIERVPGGWLVLNAATYAALVTRTVAREQTRQRVARHRAKQSPLPRNGSVTPSDAYSETETKTEKKKEPRSARRALPEDFVLTDLMAAKVRDAGCLDPAAAFAQFRAHHLAHGSLMASWPHAWGTWVSRHGQYGCPCRPGGGGGRGGRPSPRDHARTLAARWAEEAK